MQFADKLSFQISPLERQTINSLATAASLARLNLIPANNASELADLGSLAQRSFSSMLRLDIDSSDQDYLRLLQILENIERSTRSIQFLPSDNLLLFDASDSSSIAGIVLYAGRTLEERESFNLVRSQAGIVDYKPYPEMQLKIAEMARLSDAQAYCKTDQFCLKIQKNGETFSLSTIEFFFPSVLVYGSRAQEFAHSCCMKKYLHQLFGSLSEYNSDSQSESQAEHGFCDSEREKFLNFSGNKALNHTHEWAGVEYQLVLSGLSKTQEIKCLELILKAVNESPRQKFYDFAMAQGL